LGERWREGVLFWFEKERLLFCSLFLESQQLKRERERA
jgi:hypothetical protein